MLGERPDDKVLSSKLQRSRLKLVPYPDWLHHPCRSAARPWQTVDRHSEEFVSAYHFTVVSRIHMLSLQQPSRWLGSLAQNFWVYILVLRSSLLLSSSALFAFVCRPPHSRNCPQYANDDDSGLDQVVRQLKNLIVDTANNPTVVSVLLSLIS